MINDLSFASFDVETANPRRGSICAIGVTVVRGGVHVSTHSWLCKPPEPVHEFGEWNMRVHKITPRTVAYQPGFARRLPEVLAVIGDLPVVAHNAPFDMDNLARACEFSGVDTPDWHYGCTLAWSKHRLTLPKYRLPVVAEALGVPLLRHHDAGADSRAAADITIGLAALTGARNLPELARAHGDTLFSLRRGRARI
ncbi:3'-5' exonuclease [Nocardia aurea]|uniref:3'-5' exonuclease n=1 Tax=Nocardia aurea TaxID=2144174 RepID=UPI0033B17DBD